MVSIQPAMIESEYSGGSVIDRRSRRWIQSQYDGIGRGISRIFWYVDAKPQSNMMESEINHGLIQPTIHTTHTYNLYV